MYGKPSKGPIFKQSIFASTCLAIIDHSDLSYKYLSPTVKDFTGYGVEEFLPKGPAFFMSLSDNMYLINPVIEKISGLVMALPREERIHFHLFYDFRITKADGQKISMYQQTIPLALNDEGYPYLMLCVVSDVTKFKKDTSINYRATLNLPGQPIKVLLSGCIGEAADPLTEREKEIVIQLADGMDSQGIADKLFIAEDTVRTHRKNMLEKTGAKNTVHLVRMAIANGWV